MKKIFQKNQIAITALAIMIAVAGYLNFTEQNTSSDGTKKFIRECKRDADRRKQ